MHSSGIHKSCNEGNYRKLGESKSHYTEWKSQDGKEYGVLLLRHSQSIEMSAIAVTDSHDSDGDLAPLEYHSDDGEPVIEVECAYDPFSSKHSTKHKYCAKDGYSENYTQNSWAFVGLEVSLRVGVF
jgi:hypothetical protein